MSKNKSQCEVVSSSRMIIKKQVLASLTDEGKVALILDLRDLNILIKALGNETERITVNPRQKTMLQDLKQLRDLAFPETIPRGSKK